MTKATSSKKTPVAVVEIREGYPGREVGPAVALVGPDAFEQTKALLAGWRKEGKRDVSWSVRWKGGTALAGWYTLPRPETTSLGEPCLGAFLYDATCTMAEGGAPLAGPKDVKEAKMRLATLAFCVEEAQC